MALSTAISLIGFAIVGNVTSSLIAIHTKKKKTKEEPIIPLSHFTFKYNSSNKTLIKNFIDIIENVIIEIKENKKKYTKIIFVDKGNIVNIKKIKNVKLIEITNFKKISSQLIKLMLIQNNLARINKHLLNIHEWKIGSIQNDEIIIEKKINLI